MKAPVSAVVVAYNEELHIERCLRSVSWAAETIVVDSQSEDRTAELAEGMGARVLRRPWPGYSAQKNFGTAQATQPWIFSIDADEEVTQELAAEIQGILSEPEVPEAGFLVRRPLYFLGRELGHYGRAARDPGDVRLFRNGRARFDGAIVHEQVLVDGPVGWLRATMFHDSYPTPALRTYWRKIHRYAPLEARQRIDSGERRGIPWVRALGKLTWMMLVRKGLLDGPPAWIWIAGQAYQEWLTTAEAGRLHRARKPASFAPAGRTGERDAL